MKYIVLDLEWNSPEHRNRLVKEPIVLHGEIIQIGAVMLNEQMEEIGSFEAKIRPEFYKRINRKIEELTGITDKDLENALLFTDAINNFNPHTIAKLEFMPHIHFENQKSYPGFV